MSLEEIKAAIPKLSAREQAELDLWIREREDAIERQAHLIEMREKLAASYNAVAAGRSRPWTEETMNELRDEARQRRSTSPER